MDSQKARQRILMLPWLAHGHISPFLELSKKLAEKGFQVYFCSTPVNLESVRETLSPAIRPVEIHIPPSADLLPEYHNTKDLPPRLMPALKTAFDGARAEFSRILGEVGPRVLIYDFLMPWAPEAAREREIEPVIFLTTSAASSSFLTYCSENPYSEYPFPPLNFPSSECRRITRFLYDSSNGLTNMDRFMGCLERSSTVLVKTSREIEAKYVDYLSTQLDKDVIPVGPLLQSPPHRDSDASVIGWLEGKDATSVVYVSFGTECFLSGGEIHELACGLELSHASFVWVLRFPRGENVILPEALPEGFLHRVGDRGMVIEGWAPQARILQHGSVGGFVSHCGWSSTLEGLMFGVPIVAVPMQLDQPVNARAMAEIGAAVEVGRLTRDEVARAVRLVVGEGGREVREMVRGLSQRLRERGDTELDIFVEKLG